MKNNKNAVVNKVCHSRKFLSGISRILSRYVHKGKTLYTNNLYVEDPRLQPSGMTPLYNNGGFTLIELLVVVLIIGILAAVALPQYQVATKKAKLMALTPLMDAIYKAEQTYFLSHGEYTYSLSELDIEIPSNGCTPYSNKGGGFICGNFRVAIHGTPSHVGAALLTNEGNNELQYAHYFDTDEELGIEKENFTCSATGNTADKICQSLGIQTDLGGKGVWEHRYILR